MKIINLSKTPTILLKSVLKNIYIQKTRIMVIKIYLNHQNSNNLSKFVLTSGLKFNKIDINNNLNKRK